MREEEYKRRKASHEHMKGRGAWEEKGQEQRGREKRSEEQKIFSVVVVAFVFFYLFCFF